jgi:NAD-dependent dihydropyrimidine dehydrogenase PreA subunit
MGHHLGTKDSLIPLIDRLNKYPIGLVDTEKLREILGLLFDEREAFVASRFPLEEATLAELVKATGLEAAELQSVLETMADRGLVMDMPYAGTTYYLLMPGLIGFFEFTFMKRRADLPMERLATLMHEYLHESQSKEFFGSKTQLTRTLAYEEHIPVTSEIATYEQARAIIRQAGVGAVGLCYCRHKKSHQGRSCAKGAPMEGICISLGSAARFLSRRGFAELKTEAELLEVIDRARDLRLTHVTDNIREKPSFICNCCHCCCELMAGVQMGFHEGIAKTGFTAVIDPERCDYCGTCFSACNVKAIGLAKDHTFASPKERFAEVKEAVCLGCGACISACEKGALKLIPAKNRQLPPLKKRDLFVRILKEKKRLGPFVTSRLKKQLRRAFTLGRG